MNKEQRDYLELIKVTSLIGIIGILWLILGAIIFDGWFRIFYFLFVMIQFVYFVPKLLSKRLEERE